jgi:hypothetical protein
MYENQDRIGKVNLSQSEVITLNNRGRFLYVLDQKLNKKVNVKLKKVQVSENDVHCDVVVELENRDEKVIKNYYTIEKLMTSLKDEPHKEEETIEAKIVT